jgi:succinate dehydrogenase/fumarate reductase flavoprotein subunit
MWKEVETDVLVVGSGGAGMFAAIEAVKEGQRVLIVTKGTMGRDGSTIHAFPVIQSPLGHEDSRDNPEVFAEDIMKRGGAISNYKVVRAVAEASIQPVLDLNRWGVPFKKKVDGRLIQDESYVPRLSTYARVIELPGPLSGPPIALALRRKVSELDVHLMEYSMLTSLLTNQGGVVGGMILDRKSGDIYAVKAKAVVLATGACSEVYKTSLCPRSNTGDGQAIAYRAGAEMVDMEFVRFYNMALYPESIRGVNVHAKQLIAAGAKLPYDRSGEVADIGLDPEHSDHGDPVKVFSVARSGRGSERGGVYFDVGSVALESFNRIGCFETGRFLPRLGTSVLELGPGVLVIDGGVGVNENCESSVGGLYATGDLLGGFWGASYTGATGVILALSTGCIAGRSAAKRASRIKIPRLNNDQIKKEVDRLTRLLVGKKRDGVRPSELRRSLQEVMSRCVWVVRSEKGLKKAIEEIQGMKKEIPRLCVSSPIKVFNNEWVEALEMQNLVETSEMMARAALMREETRGDHRREDFPNEDPEWKKNIVIKKEGGRMRLRTQPVK